MLAPIVSRSVTSACGCLLLALAVGCERKDAGGAAPAPSVARPVSSASGALPGQVPAGGPGCLAELDYLVPPQKYSDGDLFRAIVVHGEHVYVRNYHHVFRVSLGGGALTEISKAPALQLSGTTVLWANGDRLLTQSAGEPIFMQAPSAGGPWTTFIDLTREQRGGGQDPAARILQGLGKSGSAKATQAFFDGQRFYWTEVTRGKGAYAAASSKIRSVALSGGVAPTLFEGEGELTQLEKAADHLVFMRQAAPAEDAIKKHRDRKQSGNVALGLRGDRHLMTLPVAGGPPLPLARIGNIMAREVLLTDGSTVYVTGFENEDFAKPGVFRIGARPGSTLERLDARIVNGQGFLTGDRLVFAGQGMIEPGTTTSGQLVLTGTRNGKTLQRVACIAGTFTSHAFAVSDKTLFMSIFNGTSLEASIVKIRLP